MLTIKENAYRTLVKVGAASFARKWNSDSAVILAYHNIVPRGESFAGEDPLHLGQDEFAEQLDRLSTTHRILGLEELLGSKPASRPRAAITFDDGYLGAVSVGLEELRLRDLPATYFVSPALLGRATFWWDALASANSGFVSPTVRRHALTDLRGRQEQILAWAECEGIRRGEVPEHCRSARLEELRQAASLPGVTIGSHTWSHPNMRRISPIDLNREVERSSSWLMRKVESYSPWLAYPYGIVPDLPELVSESGVQVAFSTRGEFTQPEDPNLDSMRIPRINISSGISRSRFELLTSGIHCKF